MSYLRLLCVCIVFYGILACGGGSDIPRTQKLNVGYVPIAVALPLVVAQDEGYFRDEGFEVSLQRLASSNELANAATAGQIDVSVVATNVMLDIGFVSKKHHTLVITNLYTNREGFITDYILVRDSKAIQRLEDLRGKRIGIFPGSVIKVFCHLILKKYGLNDGDYELIELAPKDWASALQTGQIDALSALEPQATQIIQDKLAVPIVNGFYSQLMPDVPLSAHWISEDYVKANGTEQVKKIIRAIDRAVSLINSDPEKARSYLVKYANVREDVVSKVQLNPWKPHDQVDRAQFQQFIDLLYENGAIQNKENASDYFLQN